MLFSLAFVNTLDSNGLNELKDLFTLSNFLIISFEIMSKDKENYFLVEMLWMTPEIGQSLSLILCNFLALYTLDRPP